MKKPNLVRTVILATSLLLQLGTLCFRSLGAAGDVDLSFDPGSSVTNPVSAVVVQADGKVLIGGPFTFINGTNHYGSARLNADGSLDNTFIPISFNPDLTDFYAGPGGYVEVAAIAVQSDGKVLAGGLGLYACVVGEEGCQPLFRSFVTRLNPNGSRDTDFTPFVGPFELAAEQTAQVRTVAVQPDGQVVIGYDGYGVVRGIVRLNANGIQDTNFNASVDYPGVYSVVPLTDGKLLMGGSFSTVNGTNRSGLARLNSDGSLDSTFNPGVGGYPLALQPDGKVLVGGYARLNVDGSLDNAFNPGAGAYGYVRSIALQADGNVIVVGNFTSIKGVLRQYVARLYGADIPPALSIAQSNAFVIVSWPVSGLNFQLQESTNLALPNSWSPAAQPVVTNVGRISTSLPMAQGSKFFRLQSK